MPQDAPRSNVVNVPALEWVRPLLTAGDPDACVIMGHVAPEGYSITARYLLLPQSRDPYLLTPLDSRRAAAEAISQVGNPLKGSYQIAERAFAMLLRSGAPQEVLRRQQVSVCHPLGHRDSPRLNEILARHLNVHDVEMAIVLGRERPNRKPVIRVMDRTGRPLAFVKVGWNDVSRSLVEHEIEVLTAFRSIEFPPSLRTPALLGSGSIGNLILAFIEPAPTARHHRPPSKVPLRATRELARLGGVSESDLRDHHYWERLQRRVDSLAGDDDPTLDLHRRTLASLDSRYGRRTYPFGRWHGDWTPWNMMMSSDGVTWAWDWERSEEGVPLGLDLAHFDFDMRVKVHGQAPSNAAIDSVRSIAADLEQVGLPSGSGHLIASLHLLEMSLRFREADALGHRVRDDLYADALSAILRPTRASTG